jgi:hypothetical protein
MICTARLAPLAPRRAEVGGVEGEVLERGERAVEVRALGDDREAPLDLDGPRARRRAVDGHAAARRLHRVVIAPIVVVLPAPLGPSSPKISPSRTSKEIPATASGPGPVGLVEIVDDNDVRHGRHHIGGAALRYATVRSPLCDHRLPSPTVPG